MIYFIRSYNQFIKIGTSVDVDNRRKSLQTASPLKLHVQAVMEGNHKTEQGLHEIFAHLRKKG